MITVWFESHKTSLDNEAGLASGWNDVDLSPLGAGEQMQECVERYAKIELDEVFSSDLQRAYKTAYAIAAERKLPVYLDARLRECNYGELTQHPKKEVDDEKLLRISNAFPGGESYEGCMHRMHNFLEYLKGEFEGKTVLIVGHRATQYGIENFILKKPLDQCLNERWKWQPGWKYTY